MYICIYIYIYVVFNYLCIKFYIFKLNYVSKYIGCLTRLFTCVFVDRVYSVLKLACDALYRAVR